MSLSNQLNQALNFQDGRNQSAGIPTKHITEMLIEDSETVASRGLASGKRNLKDALEDFDKSRTVILSASDALQKQTEDSSKKTKECVSRAKDAAAQMTDAMNKITKLLGPDFEKRLTQLDHLTTCMERLAVLNESGKLAGVLDALRK